MRRILCVVYAASAVPMGAALAQQTTLAVEAGAVSVRFADQGELSALTFTPSMQLRAPHLAVALVGSASQVRAGRWSSQGTATFAAFTRPSARGLIAEIGGATGGSAFPGGARTAQGIASARVHWLGAAASSWIGAGIGAMFDGADWRDVRQAEIGAVVYGRAATLTVVATPSVTDDTLAYTDLLALMSRSAGVFDLTASVGGRLGATLPIAGGERRLWGGVSAVAWIAPRAALTMGVGTYPVDLTQGFPAGRYLSAGLRFGAARSLRASELARSQRVARTARAGGIAGFALRRSEGSVFEVRVRAPSAREVLVNGDVTGWRPIALVPEGDGWWRGRLVIEAGTAELVLRVDGGAWVVPPGAEEIVDEFGGRSGRVVVPAS